MTHHTRRAALGILAAGAASPLVAEPVFLDSMGVAIRGYDPVAYFQMEEAMRGSMDHELETDTGIWWFTSAEHRDLFRREPERFSPEFGGYCAEGLARGFKRHSDPTLWVMIDGRVYLHYSIPDQNRWAADIRGNIRLARENWATLRDL